MELMPIPMVIKAELMPMSTEKNSHKSFLKPKFERNGNCRKGKDPCEKFQAFACPIFYAALGINFSKACNLTHVN